MLKTAIRRTPFNTDVANDFFKNITGDKYMQDDVLVSVARAILPQRMEDGDSVQFHYQSKYINAGRHFEGTAEECEASITSEINLSDTNLVTIYYFTGVRREDSAPYMDAIKEHFVHKHRGWEENMTVRHGLSQYFPIYAFVNRSKRNVVIFMGESDIPRQRWATLAVFSCMPWYFADKGIPLTDEERELLNCLTAKSESTEVAERKFRDTMERMAAKYDFEKIRVGQLLDGFETRYERREIENAQAAIRRNDEKIADLNSMLRDELSNRRENTIRLSGLKMRVEELGETSAIKDLFLTNPRLYLEHVGDHDMVFSVKTDLEYFDSEQLETYIGNRRSWVYQEGRIASADMVKLLRALFIDNTLRLQVCGCYKLDMGGRAYAQGDHEFPDSFSDYMPNTHVNAFTCLGGHNIYINERLQNGDYVGAIMQCIASCQSLNFGDSAVMERFMEYLHDDTYSGIRLPDGRVVKPSEAVKWLNEQGTQEVRGEQQEDSETPAEAEA